MFVVNLKQNKMKYTVEQFEKHGTEILAYHNGKDIEAYYLDNWLWVDKPMFDTAKKYRIKKEPFYTNEIGETFDIGDGFYYYKFNGCKIKSGTIDKDFESLELDKNDSETTIFKTIKGALEAGIKMYS